MTRRSFIKAFGMGMIGVVGLGNWNAQSAQQGKREIKMVEDGFIWIDATDFTDYGGWLLDTQFVHLMGSAYLIAAGAGTPVRDAIVDVEIPYPSTYRLWVRTKDWLPRYSPGRFQVLVNGVPAKVILGTASTERWLWQSAGEFRLGKGRTRITLRDLTGYYGRCASLLLSTHPNYTPPEETKAVINERSRLTGMSLKPRAVLDFDIVVVGGGVAGCCAAIAAARLGAKTALVHGRSVLGGNASDELGVAIAGASASHPHARETGIVEEARLLASQRGSVLMSEPLRMLTESEDNLSVFLNEQVIGVRMADADTIAGVIAVNTLTGDRTEFRAKMFIDCTGDGWVGYYAGAEYRIGREARHEFNEDLAPEEADDITMSGCIMNKGFVGFRAVKENKRISYSPPPWAVQLPPAEKFGRHIRRVNTGEWWLEHPGDIDDLWDMERARDELIRIAFGYWHFIKNVWHEREKAAQYRLTDVFIYLAKRETRRLVGDYILTQGDVQSGKRFFDSIAYGGWPIDVHHPKGIFSGEEGPFHCNVHVPIYTIPFRCLYSINIRNLLFAGRDISVTHIALGTVRVMATLATLGQAAGTAAVMCVKDNITPRQLAHERKRIHALQQTLLKHDQYIPGVKNEDPADLALKATVSASSTATHQLFAREHVEPHIIHPLNMPRAVMFPVGVDGYIKSIWLLLASERAEPTEVTLHLRGAQTIGDFSSRTDLQVARAIVPANREAWVEFKLNFKARTPYLWVWLPKADGVYWRLMKNAPHKSCRAWGGDGAWHVVRGRGQYYAFFTEPPIRLQTDYHPQNVINGVSRITEEGSNLWVSDPRRPLPQWLELIWDAPIHANAVYITFDTDLNPRWTPFPPAPECVRDYELLCYHDNRWISLAKVVNNQQRRCIHRFDTVSMTRLRLTVHATHGDPSARVFEIRVYRE